MGSAHVAVSHELYAEIMALRSVGLLPMLEVLRAVDFGDGTMFMHIESPALPSGYHGSQDLIWHRSMSTTAVGIRVAFKADCDV